MNTTVYSTIPADEPTLEQLSALLSNLSRDQRVAVAMASLYEAYEPHLIDLDYRYCPPLFDRCIERIQYLSTQGKVALVRAIAEQLATTDAVLA